jgi:predicted transcriptional regulator
MKVFTIRITNEITGRVDHLECPTKAERARIAGEYIHTLSKYPSFIHADSFLTQTIVSFADGKRVTLDFGSNNK